MTSVAEPILREKLAELQAQARKAWSGLEREAVIEIVRSADYAAYIIHSSSGDESLDELRLILNSVAPTLATFLPLMKGGKGLPFGPATPQIADWIDSMLIEFGKLARLQRFAAMERYGLSRSEMVDAATMRLEMQAGVAELMDRHAARWLNGETMRRVGFMQGPPPWKACSTRLPVCMTDGLSVTRVITTSSKLTVNARWLKFLVASKPKRCLTKP
ncbi:hypothetical protein [Bradyrhizobium sp. AZCC 2289]|uniref:hypothetical protein n=1 Tax=Bradyrhizobium sp. AZCC 2289 TaxID=3117026 RepID=UPI002FF136E8